MAKYDVVYFVKNVPNNEELRHSLRSIEENWVYNKVWFAGGCPVGIKPDYWMKLEQKSPTKWENVRNMMREVCLNDDITANFWLFNDDFFVLKPVKTLPPLHNGTIIEACTEVEARHGNEPSEWTEKLRKLNQLLIDNKKPTLNYAVHKPMLVDRKKMLKVIDMFPDVSMIRALYGNWWELGGKKEPDCKVAIMTCDLKEIADSWTFVSTSDESFLSGTIGLWLRDRFPNKSRFEE